jgi:hypothetical protein
LLFARVTTGGPTKLISHLRSRRQSKLAQRFSLLAILARGAAALRRTVSPSPLKSPHFWPSRVE